LLSINYYSKQQQTGVDYPCNKARKKKKNAITLEVSWNTTYQARNATRFEKVHCSMEIPGQPNSQHNSSDTGSASTRLNAYWMLASCVAIVCGCPLFIFVDFPFNATYLVTPAPSDASSVSGVLLEHSATPVGLNYAGLYSCTIKGPN
jgi:hypothetical protein